MNAYTLSMRVAPNDTVKDRLQRCVMATLPPSARASAPDIEEVVARNTLVAHAHKFKFECTGCGECCRSADNIFISPSDLFRMSRAPNMKVHASTPPMCLRPRLSINADRNAWLSLLLFSCKE